MRRRRSTPGDPPAPTPGAQANHDRAPAPALTLVCPDHVAGGLESTYHGIASFIVVRPYTTISLCLALTALLGLGWLRLEVEERPDRLYTVQGSRATDDQDFVDAYFGQSARFLQVYYIGDNLVADRGPMRDLFAIDEAVENDVDNGELQELCIRAQSGGCVKSSPLGFWNYSLAAFEADPDWVATLSQTDPVDDPNTFSGEVSLDEILGSVTRDGTGRITRLEAMRFEWVIEERLITEDRREYDPVAEDFEEKFDEYIDDFDACCGSAIPDTAWQFDESIAQAFAFDALLTAVAYVLLTTYACTVLSAKNRVHSRSSLGLVAVLSVGCAVVSAFGLLLACGVPFSLVVNSVVFVMLGLGVDDAFVIMECLGQQPATLETDQRIKLGLAKAGAAITLTSATDFVAFLVGSSTIIPALQAFCIFASITILFDFFYQVTLFVAFLKLDERRIEANVADYGCFCPAYCVADPKAVCCAKDKEFNEGDAFNNSLRSFITRILPDAILSPVGKVAVLAFSALLLALGIVGILRLELDFQYDWFVPTEAADATGGAAKALRISEDYFSGRLTPLSMYTASDDHYLHRAEISSLCSAAAANVWVTDSSVNCWYDEWNEETGDEGANAPDAATFYASLRAYVDGPGSRFEDYVLFTSDNSSLIATEIPMSFVFTESAEDDIDAMDSVRATVDNFPNLRARAFGFSFVFLEGLKVIYEETVRNVLLALVAVFFMTTIFLADMVASTIVLLVIGFVDVILLGFIHWLGMYMNTVTSINLILAIGLVVDYSAHIAHAYMHSAGTRDERAKKALDHIGVSVFNGGATSFIATLALAPATTFVFQTFFRCFVLIIVFGLYAGLVLMPVVLSLVGPSTSYAKDDAAAFDTLDKANKATTKVAEQEAKGH